MAYYGWAPYVPVAERRRKAQKKMDRLRKQGIHVEPVEIQGRRIAQTFWGKAWCERIESFHDYDNRLPRGRTYVRNGSVCHLAINRGEVKAMVSGSEIYHVDVEIDELSAKKWKTVQTRCGGRIGSLLELLQGRLSHEVMEVVTCPRDGLFPKSQEIRFRCNCFDWAEMCKHVAAVLYGVGARLDRQPELLFRLRGVNHEELIQAPADQAVEQATRQGGRRRTVAADKLGDVFGIDLEDDDASKRAVPPKKARSKAVKKTKTAKQSKHDSPTAKKKTVKKKTAKKAAPTAKRSLKKKAVKKKAAVTRSPKKASAKKKAGKKAVKKPAASAKSSRASKARKRTPK